MSSAHPSLDDPLAVAAETMGRYEWSKAAELYSQALEKLDPSHDPLRVANVAGLLAKCYFKAAFQTDSRDSFRRVMELSQGTQEKAATAYKQASARAPEKRAMSRAKFAGFWLQDEPDEKRALLEKSILLGQEAAHEFEVQGDRKQLAETLVDLVAFRENALHLSTERKTLINIFEIAVETACRVIEDFRGLEYDQAILEAFDLLVRLYTWAESVIEQPRYEELEKKLGRLRDKIAELLERVGTPDGQALACEASHMLAGDLDGDIAKALVLAEKGLAIAKSTRDHYMIGRFDTIASVWVRYAWLHEEYAEKRRQHLERALELASDAIKNLEPSSPGTWLKYAYGMYVEAFTYLALIVETDLEKKRALLQKAIDSARKGMAYEKHSFVLGTGHNLSKALYFLATMDVGPEEKAHRLSEALPIRQETVRTFETLCPHSWNRGVVLNYLALLKAELSKIEKDQPRRLELLTGASNDIEQCVKLCTTLAGIGPPPLGKIRVQAQYNEWHGDILQQLYNTTLDSKSAHQAIATYEDTISYLSKSESFGSIPTVRWKIAQAHESLSEYKEASQSFHQASEEYRLAAKKISGLSSIFEDFAQYMEAWALIEDARLNHDHELYSKAAEDYTKVANLLRATNAWSYLSAHYSACSLLELGEALSRQERLHAAIESFNAARATFQETRNALDLRSRNSRQDQEKNELKDWLEVTQGRLKYSLGRTQLEEAKVLDARMEEESSSAKYQAASETFAAILSETPHQPTKVELDALRLLCEAWAKMKAAEVSASPELYASAADLFIKVERTATGKRSRLSALANASMCKALEAGSVFRRTRDKRLYEEIKKQLESAADFYEEAQVTKAADWTRATQRFFDALVYLGDAEIETDTGKKTELYHLAERHLQLAAKLYGDAGYSRKKAEALRHLERAQEEKQLLLTPVEVLAESPAIGEVAVAPVSLTRDRAVGLERLETANAVGSMTVSESELHAGEDLTLDMAIVNIGKATAMLIRVENFPEKGLELAKEKAPYHVEKNTVNMRGRRLDYMKTHQEKIMLRARRKGTYEIRPRIVFADDKGNLRSYEFEPTTVTVKELGVLGWVRGPN